MDFEGDYELKEISDIFSLVDFKYSDRVAVSKDYNQYKDLLELNGYNLKLVLPLFLIMSKIWINNIVYK